MRVCVFSEISKIAHDRSVNFFDELLLSGGRRKLLLEGIH